MAKRRLRPEEADLWRAALADTEPLPGRRRPAAAPRAPAPEPAEAPRPPAAARPASPAAPPAAPAARPAGLDRRQAERLRRGQLPIEGRLDLHGMSQAAAHRALADFVQAGAEAGRRCLLVITGRGAWRAEGGVLRAALPRWLAEPALRAHLLAVAPARPQHGGAGAFYLLLRRRRRP